jgi:nucleoside-diphosphate-sugar epimerase
MSQKRALVTGAQGFVGRHMVRLLDSQGFDVDEVDIINGSDVRNAQVWPTWHYAFVVHAAAHVGGRVDIDSRAAYIGAYNSQLDGAMFEWVLRAKPDRFVYLSSSAAYPVELQGESSAQRLRESDIDPLNPRMSDSTYGAVKLHGERIAAELFNEGLKAYVVRPFSGYGEDQPIDYPFPSFAKRACQRDDPFEIWGDSRQVRDWIHIDDVVRAIYAVVDSNLIGKPVNLCTGIGTDMTTLAEMFMEAAGYNASIRELWDMPMGVMRRVGDPSLMRCVYTPRVSLAEGVRRALAAQ